MTVLSTVSTVAIEFLNSTFAYTCSLASVAFRSFLLVLALWSFLLQLLHKSVPLEPDHLQCLFARHDGQWCLRVKSVLQVALVSFAHSIVVAQGRCVQHKVFLHWAFSHPSGNAALDITGLLVDPDFLFPLRYRCTWYGLNQGYVLDVTTMNLSDHLVQSKLL